MKFTLLTALLAAAVPAGAEHLFNQDILTEYMWCCQDAECWSACEYLCEVEDKPDYCVGGMFHPGSQGNANGDGDTVGVTLLDMIRYYYVLHPEETPPAWVTNHENPPQYGVIVKPKTDGPELPDDFRQRALELVTGCGAPPPGIPDLNNAAFSKWFDCYLAFYFGNEFSRQHCQTVLPIGVCRAGPEVSGDPHFRTWVGEWYDYHGECDLNFLHAPSFAHGLGLDIHVRTKVRYSYSYIESVAVKIGSDVMEVGGWGEYVVNGVQNADLKQTLLGPFDIDHNPVSNTVHRFTIGEGDHVVKITTIKDIVAVTLGDNPSPADFIDSVGMLGRFGSGMLYGRDGDKIFTKENINDFGQEWQILPEEPKLFQNVDRAPQHPEKCRLPDPVAQEQRRLGQSSVTEEEAQEACSGWSAIKKQKCVYDVLATGDLEFADAGAF